MEHIPNETPPVERRAPMPEWIKTTIMVVLVVILAAIVGSILQDANAGRIFTGVIVLGLLVYFFIIGGGGRSNLGTDGHGRRSQQFPGDD